MLSPSGNVWLYGTLRSGLEYHAVDIRSGSDTTLWGSDHFFHVIGLDDEFAYANDQAASGSHLWELPLDGSNGMQLNQSGGWSVINQGSAWGTGASALPPGAPYSLQRLDLKTGKTTSWLQLSTSGNLVGFDANGAPIVQVGGAGGDVIVASAPNLQKPVAKSFMFAKQPSGATLFTALGDSHGIWLAGVDGVYLSVSGVATRQSIVQAFPAGPCSSGATAMAAASPSPLRSLFGTA
jgi:hypothetical protein